MKEISNTNEWILMNLDLIEECQEKGIKPIIFVAGASSSGKSFMSKQLKLFLESKNIKSYILSTDNYNKGIAKNIFNFVDDKYFSGKIQNKQQIIENIRKIIENEQFDKKFCKENLLKIKKSCTKLLNVDMQTFLSKLAYEFENINFDQKNIYDLQEFSQDLVKLLNNQTVNETKYSKLTSERINTQNTLNGKDIDVIIVEGIYALDKTLTKNIPIACQITNFIDCNFKHLFLRRIIRDSQITNCSIDFIIKNYIQFVFPEYKNTVLLTKQYASFVLDNNMSFDELRQGKLSTQTRYKINAETLKKLLKNAKITQKVYQEDIYFGSKDDKDILRLRLEGTEKDSEVLKSFIYKGQQKTRKDKNLIRPMQVICEQEDLKKMYKDKQQILNDLKSIGITPYQTLCKQRIYITLKGQSIKIDLYDKNAGIYLELDENNKILSATSEMEKVDPIIQINNNEKNIQLK